MFWNHFLFYLTDYCLQFVNLRCLSPLIFVFGATQFFYFYRNLIGFSIMLHLFLNSHLRAEQCSKGVSMVSRCIRDINYDYVTRI